MRVLIIAPHASHKWGGEAILPLHYFNRLAHAKVETWMLLHERSKPYVEEAVHQRTNCIFYIKDSKLHKILYRIQKIFPDRIGSMSFGIVLKLAVQFEQRSIAKKLISEHQIDIVHEPIPVSPKTPSALFGMKVPVVIGPMNGGMNFPPGFEQFRNKAEGAFVPIGRFFSHLFNMVIPGKYLADVLLVANARTKAALPANRAKKVIELVENGVDLGLFSAKETSVGFAEISQDQYRFVYVGRLVDWKAVDILLKAFGRINNVDCTLDIIGDGEDLKALTELAKGLKISDRVIFNGLMSQSEVSQKLVDCHCLVLPSVYECGGAVVLEAMAMRLPVIATDWGGPADYIDDSTGILVDPTGGESELVQNLASAMESVLANPASFNLKGESGRRKVENLFSWDKKIEQMINIYEEAIKNHRIGRQ